MTQGISPRYVPNYNLILTRSFSYGNMQEQEPSLVTMFSTACASGLEPTSQIVCFRTNPESNQIYLIMRGGDIGVLSLDDTEPMVSGVAVFAEALWH